MNSRQHKTKAEVEWRMFARPVLSAIKCALVITFCTFSFTSACAEERSAAAAAKATVDGYEVTFPALGTLVEIKVFAADESLVRRTIQTAEERTKAIETILTDYDPDSEASQLTVRAAAGVSVPVSKDLWKVLEASDRWYRISGGAFDASLGSLTHLWRGARRTGKPLADQSRVQALERCGWENVKLDSHSQSVQFLREGVKLDFGAIGKGYVVDEVFTILQTAGLKQCLVNISGNMRAGDAPPDRDGWRIEIAPLEKGQPPLRRLMLANISIATSGDLWQFIMVDGQRRSHILDPRTGESARGPIAATVIAASAADADACATAVCVLGPSAGAQLVESLSQTEALILEHSEFDQPVRYVVTSGFAGADLKN